MSWTVKVLNEIVAAEIAVLPKDVQASFFRLTERIKAVGLEQIREPHIKKLHGKIWEMRLTGRDGIGRALYVTAVGQRVVVLHAFMKKTQKTPSRALEMAVKRAREIEND